MKRNTRQPNRTGRAAGFSLVEVLIALVIMSVGMLGIAGLYVQSLQAGRTSMFRHTAITMASDVADRIRANPLAGAAYAVTPGVDNNCVAQGIDCNAAQMAAHDVFLWENQVRNTLPLGVVTITFDGAQTPPTYTIAIDWDEPQASQNYTIAIPVLDI